MLDTNTVHTFRAPNGASSKCQFRWYRTTTASVAILMEYKYNPGMSVTNAIEHLIKTLTEDWQLPPNTIWLTFAETDPTTFDKVTLDEHNEAHWQRFTGAELADLLPDDTVQTVRLL